MGQDRLGSVLLCVPGEATVNKHLPKSTATAQGHMHRERQKLQSTKLLSSQVGMGTSKNTSSTVSDKLSLHLEDIFPSSLEDNFRSHQAVYILKQGKDLSPAYQDLTGRFPVNSSRGNEYILVGYYPNGNYIHGIPVKNRSASVLTQAWKELHIIFSKTGTPPEVWVLDNECSHELKQAFKKEHTDFQLVPPHSHRRNQAERATQTYKNHLKAGLASMDPNYPLTEWDRIIPQCNLTLNLLRTARCNSKLSAFAYMHGNFNFAATPLAPPGTKVVALIDPTVCGSWELNGEVGWYVGPALNHYTCVECYFPKTRALRTCDTVMFFPHKLAFPAITVQDYLKQAAEDIIHILLHPPPTTVPTLSTGDPIRAALLELATTVKRVEPMPP